MVKPDVDTLSTVPDAPPVAGADRALDPAFAVVAVPLGPTCAVVAVLAGAELLLEVAPRAPYATPPTAMAVTATAMALVRFRKNMRWPFVVR
jgi:hypothetical protein